MSAQQRKYVRTCWRADKARYPKHALLFERSIVAIWVLRFGQYGDAIDRAPLRFFFRVAYQFLMLTSEMLTGVSIPKSVAVGPGLRIYHSGGIVVHEAAHIGSNFTLRHGVTIGVRNTNGGVPIIGDNVDVGACAMILGGLRIGDNARIGAGALVQVDVPANSVAFAPRATLVVQQSSDESSGVTVVPDAAVFGSRTDAASPREWPKHADVQYKSVPSEGPPGN